ncbi:YggS family pyridoxal phosphate enzyme [Cellulomonas chitinilytica]|uniref:Pyridoxal phosphate homeostasis protein n=1 Tax=Cellulomonas chitinilytica TaxID=398759 RepID=A0A919P7K2_9CELL|nr:YggS family pyridoxal phosphate-dependent enzyme [Cellulomonas chitinilytica]GIG22409.1 YggS family pyridoxal phosphate enzyme [Cellulomonas chitinilytica]
MTDVPERDVLVARLTAVRERIDRAAVAAGRASGDVRLLLATKTMPATVIRAALAADAAMRADDDRLAPVLIGENRVQELVAKGPDLVDLSPATHLIGPLQSNKVNAALRWATCVESVESLDLARRIAARAGERPVDVCVQVNVSGEPTKHGVPAEEAVDLALGVVALDGVRLVGFMTVGAHSTDDLVVRTGYALLRQVRDRVLDSGAPGTAGARELSMGMSRDLEAAVAEGATIVRVGTAVFGSRTA